MAPSAAADHSVRRISHRDVYSAQCPCRVVLDLLADKWSALAIGALEAGPQRFGALHRRLEGVSPKVLTRTLRRLEEAGFVDRTIYPAVPLHVEYALTALGRSAAVPLAGLRAWAEEHVDQVAGLGPALECRPAPREATADPAPTRRRSAPRGGG